MPAKPAIITNGSACRTIRDLSVAFAVAIGTTGRAATSVASSSKCGAGRSDEIMACSRSLSFIGLWEETFLLVGESINESLDAISIRGVPDGRLLIYCQARPTR